MPRLPLTALLLDVGTQPAKAISDASESFATFGIWDAQHQRLDGIGTDTDADELLTAAVEGDVVVALIDRTSNEPRWQRVLREALAIDALHGGQSRTLGAILFCAVTDPGSTSNTSTNHDSGVADQTSQSVRWVAWTFGAGSRALARKSTDPRFGLISALNIIVTEPETPEPAEAEKDGVDETSGRPHRGHRTRKRRVGVRQLGYRSMAPYHRQTGQRASQPIPVEGFQLDRDTDLLSAVGGPTPNPEIPDVLGSRSLRLRQQVESIPDLIDLARRLIHIYRSDAYRDSVWAWIDHFTLVTDPRLLFTLRIALSELLLNSEPPPSVDVLLPDDLVDAEDERSMHYIAFPREPVKTASRTTLPIRSLPPLFRRAADAGDVTAALDYTLRFLDVEREQVATTSVLDCVSADLTVNGQHYMVYDGSFYSIDNDYVTRVNSDVATIPFTTLQLPCYSGGDEKDYNILVGTTSESATILDRANIYLPDGKFEAADVITDNALVHIKRKGKSSTFSHLCFQAQNSCRFLRYSGDAVAKFRELASTSATSELAKSAATALCDKIDDRAAGVEVVLAILGDWSASRTAVNLPLFSRISLLHARDEIGRMGFETTIALVPICKMK